jgi:hypothetical protein
MVVFSSNLQVWSVSSLIKARHVFSSLMHKETCFCSRIQSNFVVVHAAQEYYSRFYERFSFF